MSKKQTFHFFRYFAIVLFLLVTTGSIMAQNKLVKGVVFDESKTPLPGVTVVQKGTTNGTITDQNGQFSIQVTGKDPSLSVSFVGYENQPVMVGNHVTFDIVLKPINVELGEVVAVGYGTSKKSDITGSISSVKGKDLTLLPMQQVGQALQGQVSGVMVLNTSGAPGASPIIRIRGMNSVYGGNNALIVIDGMQGGDLSSINPNDVESIEILKDASATAIYGSQGANGVVLITTKKGKLGKPKVEYGLTMGIQKVRHKIDLMNAGDYAKTINWYRATQDATGTPIPVFTDQQIADFYKNGGTDWQNEIFKDAPIQNHQLTVSGATDNVNYLISGGIVNQQGLMINSEYKRYSLRTNFSAQINKAIHFDLFYNASLENGNVVTVGDNPAWSGSALNTVLTMDPTTPVYDENGKYSKNPAGYGASSDAFNPVAAAQEPKIENANVKNNINTNLDIKILKGLTFRITGVANLQNIKNKSYLNSKTAEGVATTAGVGIGNYNDQYNRYFQNSNILTYDRMFGTQHHLVVTGVYEQQYSKYESLNLQASGYAVDITGADALGSASQILNKNTNAVERVLHSYLGRVNYSYADKYLATISYRADGSSVFGANNKWAYFPSLSLAWRASQESFLKDLNIFSDLKIRGSYGVTGNQGISPYQTLANMGNKGINFWGNSNYPYSGGTTTDVGMIQQNIANPNLKWESTKQTNFGIDAAFFKGRLTVIAEYYEKLTSNLLLGKAVPYYTGFSTATSNLGSISNKGFEFSIGGDPLVGEFKWNTNFNISFNKNKILDLGDVKQIDFATTNGGYDIASGFMQLRVGESFGDMYGYGFVGIWKTSEADQAKKYGELPGMIHWNDIDHNDSINVNDIYKIGHSLPKFSFGWNNHFSYKNFDLTLFFQGSYGNQVFNMMRIRYDSQWSGTGTALLNPWAPTNENTNMPGYINGSVWNTLPVDFPASTISQGQDTQRSSRWVEDGSYIRLKNLTFGYTIPGNFSQKYGIASLRAFVSGTNLITLTKYTGYDPEVSSFNGNDAQMGVDYNNYPTAKTYTFGINLTF